MREEEEDGESQEHQIINTVLLEIREATGLGALEANAEVKEEEDVT